MAITKIWAVKDDLNRVLNYIKNSDKTKEEMSDGLKEVLTYTTQGYKTNEKEYITGINCDPKTALSQMMNTKLSYNKMDGRLAFHAVQSFMPGEVTPEQCHALGVQLAKQMWGNRFEVVISTHLDKEHLHNHFVVNSVSWVDGMKYDNRGCDIQHFRELSDKLCTEHHLSVIDSPKGKAASHYEWEAEKNNNLYLRKIIRHDIDVALSYARSLQQFQSELEKSGYQLKLTGKHWTIRHPNASRALRFYKLSKDGRYDENHILEHLNNNFTTKMVTVQEIIHPKEYKGDHKKLKGIKALYFKYMYMLGILHPKGTHPRPPSPYLRGDIIYMDKITQENTFLGKHNLETLEDVLAFKLSAEEDVKNWLAERRIIYNKIRRVRDPELKKQYEEDRDSFTEKITFRKKELKLCKDIENRVPDIEEKLKRINDLENQKKQKEIDYERSLHL